MKNELARWVYAVAGSSTLNLWHSYYLYAGLYPALTVVLNLCHSLLCDEGCIFQCVWVETFDVFYGTPR